MLIFFFLVSSYFVCLFILNFHLLFYWSQFIVVIFQLWGVLLILNLISLFNKNTWCTIFFSVNLLCMCACAFCIEKPINTLCAINNLPTLYWTSMLYLLKQQYDNPIFSTLSILNTLLWCMLYKEKGRNRKIIRDVWILFPFIDPNRICHWLNLFYTNLILFECWRDLKNNMLSSPFPLHISSFWNFRLKLFLCRKDFSPYTIFYLEANKTLHILLQPITNVRANIWNGPERRPLSLSKIVWPKHSNNSSQIQLNWAECTMCMT